MLSFHSELNFKLTFNDMNIHVHRVHLSLSALAKKNCLFRQNFCDEQRSRSLDGRMVCGDFNYFVRTGAPGP